MGFITAITIASIVATIASTAFQVVKAKQAKKKAKKAQEARKGFEFPVEGSVEVLPIVYGKAKVGGVRVWHNTSSSFKYVTPNSDKIIQAGPPAIPSSSYTGAQSFNSEGQPIYGTINIPERPAGLLTSDKNGSKNEFLYFQQALCIGPISNVWDVIIDESRSITDPAFGSQPENGNYSGIAKNIKAAIRIDLHNNGGSDSLTSAVFPDRADAVFTGAAYANVIIRLDRDDPQFNAVPNIQYLIEGRKVRTVSGGVLSGAYVYSNNPAWCLLDYLLDTRVGAGISPGDIDLSNFETIAALWGQTIQSNVPTGGGIYQPADKARNIQTRNLPLYECNIVLDTSKPLRDNIEAILSTAGDARLVWSGGKYKISSQYPLNNAAIQLAATITDDDLLLEQEIEIKWPNSEDRLNHCIVRYNDETANFKENSAEWPPKANSSYLKGVNGRKYPVVSGWDDEKPYNSLLNSYGVWDGIDNTCTLVWKFKAPATGQYTVKLIIDNNGSITIGADVLNANYPGVATRTVNLTANQVYTIVLVANNTGGPKGAAATLTSDLGNIVWTTRSDAYSDYITVNTSDAVYQEMLTEDGGQELSNDIFEEGITDPQHALARAEELVRTSRSAFGIKFSYKIGNVYLEPGDIIKLQSETLQLGFSGDVFIRINESKVLEGAICEVVGTRFDYTQLAWAVKDDVYLKPANAYDFRIPEPEWITFHPEFNPIKNSSGLLKWAASPDSRVINYILYVHLFGDMDAEGFPIFKEIGRSPKAPFYLPLFNATSAIFGVKAVTASGATSTMTTTDPTNTLSLLYDPNVQRTVSIKASHIAFIKSLAGNFNTSTITLTASLKGFSAPTYKWYVDDVEIVGQTEATLNIASFDPPVNKTYKVEVREQLAPNNVYEGIDYVTIFSISEGSTTLNMTFSNESVNLLSDVNGVIYPANQLPLVIDTIVARGATVLNSGITFSKIDDGCTSSINGSTGQITITAVSQPFASIAVSATVGADTVARVISINKNLQGSTVLPRLARVQSAHLAFVTPSGVASPAPSSIAILDASVGYDTPTRKWFIDNIEQAETGSSLVLPAFPAGQPAKVVKLQISEADLSFANYDEIAIFSVKEGSDAWSFSLSDLVKAIPAFSDGSIYLGYLPYSVSSIVYKGLENYTTGHGIVYSLESISGMSASINSSTGVFEVTAVSSQSASLLVRATDPVSGATGTVKYSVTKVMDGATGSPGSPGADGSDGYSLELSINTKAINANADGSIKPGQFPFTVDTIAKKGFTVITNPAVSFIIASSENLSGSFSASGVLTVTGMSAETGYAIIRATEISTGASGTVRLNVFKVRDGATQDIQAKLTEGVTNLVAGVSSPVKLNVDTAGGLVTIAANGLVYKGTAAPGVNRTGIGISSAGIAMGYNRAVDGAWRDAVFISPLGDITISGTLSASSVISGSAVLSSGQSMNEIMNNAADGKSISNKFLIGGETVLRGVIKPQDTGAISVGSLTWNSVTGAITGGTGIAMTEFGIVGAASGAVKFSISATTGNAIFSGDIVGGSNLNITGSSRFDGSTNDAGAITSILANNSRGMNHGIRAYSGSGGGNGVYGNADNSSGWGYGGFFRRQNGNSGAALLAESSTSAPAIVANAGSGNAIEANGRILCSEISVTSTTVVPHLNAGRWNNIVESGVSTGSSTATFNATNKPGFSSTNSWWTINRNGTTYRIPVWT